jgi:hypothetical protein
MATEPSSEASQIQEWIDGLDNSSFAVREDSTTNLLFDHSTEALEAVVRTAESSRSESGWRAAQILRTWLRSGDAELEASVAAVAARWSATKDKRLVRLAGTVTAKPQPTVQRNVAVGFVVLPSS